MSSLRQPQYLLYIEKLDLTDQLTSRQVLDHHGSSGVEDDVSSVIEVMQVVATVEPSVAKDVVQHQLLKKCQRGIIQHLRGKSWIRGPAPCTDLHHFLLLGHIVL